MKQFFVKHKKWIGYTLYGLVVAFVLLILQFPSDVLRDYIQSKVHSKNPNLVLTFKKASLSVIPFGLKLTEPECRIQGASEETVFKANDFFVRPNIWSLFRKKPEYRFHSKAYGGTITGLINLQKNSKDALFSSSTEFNNIHVDANSPLPAFIKNYVNGIMKGTVTYSGADLFAPKAATGKISLTLSKGSFKFTKAFLSINVIDFKEVLIKADLKDQSLNFSDFNLKGDNFLGQTTGAINLENPIKKSRINLNGTIELTSAFLKDSTKANNTMLLLKQSLKNGKLPFTVYGTFEKPEFRLN